MAYLGLQRKPKLKKLARILNVETWMAVGLLECFWHYMAENIPTGRIERDQWVDIAEEIRFREDHVSLESALKQSGFADEMDGWDYVHDWHEHATDHVRRKLDRAGVTFANGVKQRKRKVNGRAKSKDDSVSDENSFVSDEKNYVSDEKKPRKRRVSDEKNSASREVLTNTSTSTNTKPLPGRDAREQNDDPVPPSHPPTQGGWDLDQVRDALATAGVPESVLVLEAEKFAAKYPSARGKPLAELAKSWADGVTILARPPGLSPPRHETLRETTERLTREGLRALGL